MKSHNCYLLQDLSYLADGLEGRSSNPVALLFDTLNHPGVDIGDKQPSSLVWRHHENKCISHVVLGKGRPGGCWGKMEDSLQTLSRGEWLELPMLSYDQWLAKHKPSAPRTIRATASDISQYYSSYIEEMKLNNCFQSGAMIINLTPFTAKEINGSNVIGLKRKPNLVLPGAKRSPEKPKLNKTPPVSPTNSISSDSSIESVVSKNSDDSGCCCPWKQYASMSISDKPQCNKNGTISNIQNCQRNEYSWKLRGWCSKYSKCFNICAKTVVLACGTNDQPNMLGVPGEDLHFVKHYFSTAELTQLSSQSKPVIVVGSGLSAADAVILLLEQRVPVCHVFHKSAADAASPFATLSPAAYPEYTRVFRLVTGKISDSCYHSYSQHVVNSFSEDGKCQISNVDKTVTQTLDCSVVLVMIGGHADLNFISPEIPISGIDPTNKFIHPKSNPLSVDPYTFAVSGVENMYAIGSLTGDNFVRFVLGSALGVANHLISKS